MKKLVVLLAVVLGTAGSTSAAPSKLEGAWALRIVRPPTFTPRVAVALVNLRKEGKVWSGDLTWRPPMMGGSTLALSSVEVKGSKVRFGFSSRDGDARFEGQRKGKKLEGTCTWGQKHDFEATRHERFEDKKPKKGFFPRAAPGDVGLDPNYLGVLVETAGVLDTDALVVLKDGKVVAERYFGGKANKRIHIMSCTKFLTAMAIAWLVDDGKIKSLDAPLSTWFPEWNEGHKAQVTLRHVLSHTSGIERRKMAHLLNKQRDKVKFVRNGPVPDEPGTKFVYNNEAIALLSGVIASAAGMQLDDYLKGKLFEPLGITDWAWDRDGAGNTITYAQLGMTARDLAKVGQLIADGGTWGGTQVFPKAWIEKLGTRGSSHSAACGLVWWLRNDDSGATHGYYHTGSLGQWLVVYPQAKLVAVRLRRGRHDGSANEFGNFMVMLERCGRR